MKTKIILLLTLAFLSQSGHSQGVPVYDNTNFISLMKSLIESGKQTSQLLKTVQFMKEQKERLEKVSNVVKQVQAVQEIVNNNQKLYALAQKDLRDILNSPYIKVEEINRISDSFNSIVQSALKDMNFVQQLLTSNVLNMTDAERLAILESQKERSREMVAEISLRTKRYQTIISFREMQDRINNRKINY